MKLDKDVPLPQRYPFAQMSVGDSFAVPAHMKRTTVTVAAKRYGKANGKKFTVKAMPDKSLRCWRTA